MEGIFYHHKFRANLNIPNTKEFVLVGVTLEQKFTGKAMKEAERRGVFVVNPQIKSFISGLTRS
jgi:hypothetical protein